MTPQILFVLVMLAVSLVAFALELLSVDIIALLVVVSLVLGGALTPEQAFAGFASEPRRSSDSASTARAESSAT